MRTGSASHPALPAAGRQAFGTIGRNSRTKRPKNHTTQKVSFLLVTTAGPNKKRNVARDRCLRQAAEFRAQAWPEKSSPGLCRSCRQLRSCTRAVGSATPHRQAPGQRRRGADLHPPPRMAPLPALRPLARPAEQRVDGHRRRHDPARAERVAARAAPRQPALRRHQSAAGPSRRAAAVRSGVLRTRGDGKQNQGRRSSGSSQTGPRRPRCAPTSCGSHSPPSPGS